MHLLAVYYSLLHSSIVCRILRYLGPLQLHFIKESWSVAGEGLCHISIYTMNFLCLLSFGPIAGKLDSFIHNFLSEVDATARAQVVALGGNALLCHRVVPVESGSRTSRNQAYSMLSVYGDVVLIESLST